jgi:NodT family efflux transporter outer membrane factor (OMF) lipoprotein
MKGILRTLAGTIALTALAACTTVGPNYKVPDAAAVKAPAAQGPFLGAQTPAVSQAPLPDDWWRLYDDPVLDDLVQTALAANTDIRVAAANLARAQAAIDEVRAARGINGGAHAAIEHGQQSGEAHLIDKQLPVETIGDIGFGVSYDLDLFGKLKRASEAARADAEASQAGLDLARVNVAAAVAAAYVDACAAGEDLAVAERTIRLQESTLAVTERLVNAGRGSAADLPRARALLAQARAAAPAFEARRRADLFSLAALTGRPPAAFPRAVADCAEPPRLRQPLPVGEGGAALLARRPDVREAERSLGAATARIGVAVAELYPDVKIGFSGGSSGLLSDLGKAATNYWGLSSLISWDFPTGGAQARIRQSGAAADGALARFDGVVLNALRETETGLTTYAHDLDRNAELRTARDQAAIAHAQIQQLYRAGRKPFLDALDAERTLAQSEAALAQSNGQVAGDQVKLFLALGGGWRQAPPPKVIPATDRSPSRRVEADARPTAKPDLNTP